jgi:PAT family beta-lactamase induction signal transducer AmpG
MSLKVALWQPFVGFLSRTRALELTGFIFVYKLADNLAGALVRPFLIKHGYSDWDVGVGSGLALMISVSLGTIAGGFVTQRIGVTRALWIFGVIQGLGNVGYAVIAEYPVNRTLLYAGVAVENFTSGLGNAALAILLLKMTEKRFSATQFALLTSVAALGRTISGPPAGAMAFSLGWRDFFLLSIPAAIPGLLLLQRIAPWSRPQLTLFEADAAEIVPPGPAWPSRSLWRAGIFSGAVATLIALAAASLLNALRVVKDAAPFDFMGALMTTLHPSSATEALDLIGAALCGLLCGLAVAAYRGARGQTVSVKQA